MIRKLLFYYSLIVLVIGFQIYPFTVFALENNIEQEIVEEEPLEEKIENEQEENEEEEETTTEEVTESQESAITPEVEYQTHVQNIGWQAYKRNGEMAGTSGRSFRLEGIRIRLLNAGENDTIEYQTHIENLGWEKKYKKNNEMSGTEGRSFRLEAIRIKLSGDIANSYDVYYRVYTQNFGWLGWAKNGEEAGTAGYGLRLEAIEIKLFKKETTTIDEHKASFREPLVSYTTHVQNLGWQNYVRDGAMSGTEGRSFRLEGIKIRLNSAKYTGNIEYQTQIENLGWEKDYKKNDELSGTSGKSLRLEAIKIKLTGEIADYYDVYYRVHAENFGWLDWAKNDEKAGTIGYGWRLEAIEIKLVKKNEPAPGNISKPLAKRYIKYSGYQSNIWQDYTYDGNIAGKTGSSLESLRIKLIKDDIDGNIFYSTYITGSGWQEYVSNESNSNQINKKIEAIKIRLEGDISNYYDIYYSVNVSNIGWLDWAKNDQPNGNIGFENYIQSIKIKLVEKNNPSPGNTTNIYMEEEMKVKYTTYVVGEKWQDYKENGETSGTTGKSTNFQGIKIELNKKIISGKIEYSTHVATIGWTSFVSDNVQSGTIGKNIEGIKIRLTGEIEQHYDVYYRLHVSNVGWMGWAKNGEPAGTAEGGLGAEAIEIKLVEKGGERPNDTSDTVTTSAFLSAHWETGTDGNRYFYNVLGQMVKGTSYTIGNITHHFGPTGIYLGTQSLEILDISAHNGVVDWQKVASSGIYGVILRIAAGAEVRDSRLKENIAGCKKYGIPYGIYIYSYAENYSDGVFYGNFTRSIIQQFDMHPTLGIFLDLEANGITRFMGTTEYTAVVKGFYSVVPEAEIYTYTNYADTALNTPEIRSKITWIADYRGYVGYTGNYRMWQYTSKGKNAGVNGDVDKSILYSFR